MIQFVLSLLGFGNKLARLQRKSGNALSTFNETLHDLRDVQGAIVGHHNDQQAIIDKALKVQQALKDQQASNAKIIAKIEDFLS